MDGWLVKRIEGQGIVMLEVKRLSKYFGGLAAVNELDLKVDQSERLVDSSLPQVDRFFLKTGIFRVLKPMTLLN